MGVNMFDRIISLIGKEKFHLLQNKKVLIIGIGGVKDVYVEPQLFAAILFECKVRIVAVLRAVGDVLSPVVNVKNGAGA